MVLPPPKSGAMGAFYPVLRPMELEVHRHPIGQHKKRGWHTSEPATHVILSSLPGLVPPPPLPPSPGTAVLVQSSRFTLTDSLDLMLINPRQRARCFEFAPQFLGQNARRKRDLGTAAIATIGQTDKRPIGSNLVAKPQHIRIDVTTRRRRPGRCGFLTPLSSRLHLGARTAFDPVHPFEIAQMEPHLICGQALARGTSAHLWVDAITLRGRVPCNERHR